MNSDRDRASARQRRWIGDNHFRLLENGEEFFPRVCEVIAAAAHEVLLETFILFDDKVGQQLHAAISAAAKRGVQVDMTIDGFGSPDLSQAFTSSLTQLGVRIHIFDPGPKLLGWRTNIFRRLHRKLVVVDGVRAFVGGINYSADHLADYGPLAKQDYAVEIEGPIVDEIHRFMVDALADEGARRNWLRRWRKMPRVASPGLNTEMGGALALFVTRDNRDHRDDIERQYRIAIRSARQRVIIANAYFFPGYRLLRELRKAARRGVDVTLILQGEPDMPIVKVAAAMLYQYLLRGKVRIYEYCKRPLHAKVAIADDLWSTVGSSNLDPLSLALNLEANVIIRDRAFNQLLSERLQDLMHNCCKEISLQDVSGSGVWSVVRSFFVFHFLRRFPAWAGWLPAHMPRLTLLRHHAGGNPTQGSDHVSEKRD